MVILFSGLMYYIDIFKLHICNIYVCYTYNICTEIDNCIHLHLYTIFVILMEVFKYENVCMKIYV